MTAAPGKRITHDEELLHCLAGPESDPRRVQRIAAELAAGFRALAGVTKAVAIFGSAHASRESAEYAMARQIAFALDVEAESTARPRRERHG